MVLRLLRLHCVVSIHFTNWHITYILMSIYFYLTTEVNTTDIWIEYSLFVLGGGGTFTHASVLKLAKKCIETLGICQDYWQYQTEIILLEQRHFSLIFASYGKIPPPHMIRVKIIQMCVP